MKRYSMEIMFGFFVGLAIAFLVWTEIKYPIDHKPRPSAYRSTVAGYHYKVDLPSYGEFKIAESYIGDTVCYTVLDVSGPQGISCFKHNLEPDNTKLKKYKALPQ